MNILYVIIHRMGKFGLAIFEWNCMSTVQKTCVGFKQLFSTAHQELRETIYLTIQGVGIHYANMVCNVVALLQEVLYQEQDLTKTLKVILEPNKHVENTV